MNEKGILNLVRNSTQQTDNVCGPLPAKHVGMGSRKVADAGLTTELNIIKTF
jgi:hypothetical protein